MTLSTTTSIQLGPPAPLRSFWRRWILGPLVGQLTQGISPEKLALSLAVGSLCAFFPILGAATPLCVAAGLALRLNQPVIQLVNCLTAPLYLPIVFVLVRCGDAALHARSDLKPRLLAELLRRDPAQFFVHFGAMAGHAIVGWALLAPAWIAGGYFLSRSILRLGAIRFPAGRGGRSSNGR